MHRYGIRYRSKPIAAIKKSLLPHVDHLPPRPWCPALLPGGTGSSGDEVASFARNPAGAETGRFGLRGPADPAASV